MTIIIVAFIILALIIYLGPMLLVAALVGGFLYLLYHIFFKNKLVPKELYEKFQTKENVEKEIDKLEDKINKKNNDLEDLLTRQEEVIKDHDNKVNEYKRAISDAQNLLESVGEEAVIKEVTIPIIDKTSDEIKNDLSLLKIKERELIKGSGVKFYIKPSTKREVNNKIKQIIRGFNAESEAYISNLTPRNIDTQRNRIVKSFEQVNKLFENDDVQIGHDFLELKLEKMSLIYNYHLQKERERELLKAQKEELREQQRAERELANTRKKIEKEESQFQRELNRTMEYLSKADTDIEKQLFADKIRELEEQLAELKETKADIEKREANTRAGFVYIISNIGSLGENVYKIGMTRRLEPINRINELSSASVPFKFDVHAMIFSEDAPKLENMLHKHFKDYEVNKVNTRKEFFKVELEKIKEVVHQKFDKTVSFIDNPEANEYWETKKIIQAEEQAQYAIDNLD